MRFVMRVVVLLMLSMVLSASGWAAPIEGQWVRTGDSNAGSTILIDKSGDFFRATLIEPTEGQKTFGFRSGDMVWINIKNVGRYSYQGKAMVRYTDGSYEFFDCTLEMTDPDTFKYLLDPQIEITGRAKGTPVIFKRM